MAKTSPREKKLIRVPSDLIAELSKAAVTVGKSFYEYSAEALEQAVRAHELGVSLKDAVDFFEFLKIQKSAGLTTTFSETLDYLISELYPKEKEKLYQKWYDTGVWYGKYIQAKFHNKQPIEMFEKLLSASLWDFNEVELSRNGEEVTLRCVSFTLSIERTELLMGFLEGVMHSLDYLTLEKDLIRGIIVMKLKASESAEDEKKK